MHKKDKIRDNIMQKNNDQYYNTIGTQNPVDILIVISANFNKDNEKSIEKHPQINGAMIFIISTFYCI